MMKKPELVKSTSGIRGVIGNGLDPAMVTSYGAAFGTMLQKGTVVVGRDSRPSGEMLTGAGELTELQKAILADPQTSGGLLIAVGADKGPEMIDALHQAGVIHASVIGKIEEGAAKIQII